MMKHGGGIPTDASYGPYRGIDDFCHFEDNDIVNGMLIQSYVNVTSGDADAVKVALNKQGPLSIGIDAAHESLLFYRYLQVPLYYYSIKCHYGNVLHPKSSMFFQWRCVVCG